MFSVEYGITLIRQTAHTPEWLKFFRPKVDFFDLLRQQATSTLDAAIGFHDWLSAGAKNRCDIVHHLEHRADEQKLEIEKKLANTIVTPFDREEIYDLSAKLDRIINGIKRVVKDIEFLELQVDHVMIGMAEVIANGVQHVFCSIDKLQTDLKAAEQAANESRKTETSVAKLYRQALKDIVDSENGVHAIVVKKDIYESLSRIARRVESVGEKLLHMSIKAS
jgi:uncharacterized protein Yka (UPF0111/DUF47 family)